MQSVDELLAGHARDLDEIFLLHAISRMGQEVGEAAVVGDQNQPLAHPVEPADREESLFTGHEIDHPRTTRGIEVGRDHAHRLVEHVDDPLRVWQPFAVDTNLLGLRIDSAPERGHHLPINLDAARRDQFLAGAAAAKPRGGQHLLQTLEAVVGGCGQTRAVVIGIPTTRERTAAPSAAGRGAATGLRCRTRGPATGRTRFGGHGTKVPEGRAAKVVDPRRAPLRRLQRSYTHPGATAGYLAGCDHQRARRTSATGSA